MKKCTFVKMGTKLHQLGKKRKTIPKKELEDRKRRLKEFQSW
tara:strand:- start:2422 stop:2547 length:126 start_codon:yes stop_codon:yes gene_type:complete